MTILVGEGPWALALSSTLASAMPAGAAAPWEAARSRLAWGREALCVWGAGARTRRVRQPAGSQCTPNTPPLGLYPFGYRVYPSGFS
jgi:hypothetical protein